LILSIWFYLATDVVWAGTLYESASGKTPGRLVIKIPVPRLACTRRRDAAAYASSHLFAP